jgi:chromosome segregation ATPase
MPRDARRERRDATREPTKTTVGDALRALDARCATLERDATRARDDAKTRDDALARVAAALDGLVAEFREVVDAIANERDAWTRERRTLAATVAAAAAMATTAATRAEARERDAARARTTAMALDARVREGVRYVRDVRDEFVAVEGVIEEAKARTRELEARDAARERAMETLERRAREADALLRDEIESVRACSARAETAASKAEEIGGLAADVRELAKWSKDTAAYQNRRLAALERETSRDGMGKENGAGWRKNELVTSVKATSSAVKAQRTRLDALEEKSELRARRDAAVKADVDVVKRALGEHHDLLAKVCDTFGTELGPDVALGPASSAFARLR